MTGWGSEGYGMFWQIVVAVLLLVAGYFIGAVGASQLLIVLRFGFPMLARLKKTGMGSGLAPMYKIYTYTLCLWSVVIAAAIALVLLFALRLEKVAFFVGLVITLILGVSQTGANLNNKQDFLSSVSRCVGDEKANEIVDTVMSYRL
jgi:hypothetical protein